MTTAIPTPRQLEFQDWEFGVFLHFGIRTFYEGHRDWDNKPMSPEAFNPTDLNCDAWVRTAKEAGAKYMVLVAKHHDGFADWPSAYTDFSVASSPWKGGQGDVVREFTDACHRHGMHVGLYYSPADWTCPVYDDPTEYDHYFIKQVSELLTQYGEISVIWFDGAGSDNHTYDWARIIPEIRAMQPNILIFHMGDPDYRWVGNECGIAPLPCWNTQIQENGAAKWLPAECDCMMRRHNWFYSESDTDTVKSLDELMGMYYYSIGRGCNLLLNIGPDRRGLLPEPDATRLREFGAEVCRRFGKPVATRDDCTTENGMITYNPPEPTAVDHVIIMEDLTTGEHVRRFAIKALPYFWWDGLPSITLYEGQNIGHKATCRFPLLKVSKLWLEITECEGEPKVRSFEIFNTGAA